MLTSFALSLIPSNAISIASVSSDQPIQGSPEAKVDQLFANWDRLDSPGAALAVVKDGSVVYKSGYGSANLEHNIPITPTTVFDIASVSKQFAGIAIAMLIEEGKISLDDDIHKYLPEVPDFGRAITVSHLVHHTSGIRDWVQSLAIAGWRMDDVITFEHIMKMVRHQKELNFDPGEEHLYSNTNYNLLAEIVARVTGQAFREYTDTVIFKPLGMTNTHFHDDHEMVVKNRASSYYPSRGNGFKISVNNLMALGSSSLYSTVEDMARWVINFDEPRVGDAAVIEQMRQQGVLNNGETVNYSFGLAVGKYKELMTVSHSGSWAGFRSHLIHFPEQRFGVVILSNLAGIDTGSLARQVTDIYLADQIAPEEPIAAPKNAKTEQEKPALAEVDPSVYNEYVGDYYCDELGTTYTISIKDNQLVAKHRRHDDIPLTRSGDHFIGEQWFFSEIRFQRDGKNRVTGFRLTGGRVRNLRFDKQIPQ
jgi:CubicO group peptidase (beta-lactamase class C family)